MIEAIATLPFGVRVTSFPHGIAGTVAYRVLAADAETIVIGRTTAGVSEDPALDGDYTATITLSQPGDYLIVWDFGSGVTAEEEIQVAVDLGGSYAPSLEEIGALLRARTLGRSNNELGTFTDITRPTDSQVSELLAGALGDMALRIGTNPPAALVAPTRRLVAINTAMLIELSYFPDQIQAGRSIYPQLQQLFKDGITDLLAGRSQLGQDGLPGTGDDQAPIYAFPDPDREAFVRVSDPGQADFIDGGPVW